VLLVPVATEIVCCFLLSDIILLSLWYSG